MNSATPPNREKEIFEQALDIEPVAERLAFVLKACGEDAALRTRVLALLQAHGTDPASRRTSRKAAQRLFRSARNSATGLAATG